MPHDQTIFQERRFLSYRVDILEKDSVRHAFLGRPWPPMDGDRDAALRACADFLGIARERLIILRQVHGNSVHVVRKEQALPPGLPPSADAIVTNQAGLYLCIRTADCVPILFLDPVRRVVGAAHAGWRGTVENVAARAVEVMERVFDTRPQEVLAALGPSVGICCYEVDDAVVEPLLRANPGHERFLLPAREAHWMLDLPSLNVHQLVEAGVREENIHSVSMCTACRTDLFYSRRGEGGIKGEQFSVIGMTSR